MLRWLHVWLTCTMLKPITQIQDLMPHRQMVVAKDAIWNLYISIHKEAGQCRHHSFPYYDQLNSIYAKDRATGKYAQTAADIVEEIDAEDVATANNIEE
ncbi:hypothetical protein Gotur_034437 [Gossypium turneri]